MIIWSMLCMLAVSWHHQWRPADAEVVSIPFCFQVPHFLIWLGTLPAACDGVLIQFLLLSKCLSFVFLCDKQCFDIATRQLVWAGNAPGYQIGGNHGKPGHWTNRRCSYSVGLDDFWNKVKQMFGETPWKPRKWWMCIGCFRLELLQFPKPSVWIASLL